MLAFFCRQEGVHPDQYGIKALMAHQIGATVSTVSTWFNARSMPDLLTMARFWAAYPTLNFWWLLWGEGPEEITLGPRQYITGKTERELGMLEASAIAQAELVRLEAEVRAIRHRLPGSSPLTHESEDDGPEANDPPRVAPSGRPRTKRRGA
jgi:hypothetical protein